MRVESGCDEQEQRGSSDEDLINYDAWKSTVASEVGQGMYSAAQICNFSTDHPQLQGIQSKLFRTARHHALLMALRMLSNLFL